MKILRISLHNIASLGGEHTVDFTRAPLANAGLFSISGPTGSGKSTLLDALCLALFAQTPRMAVASGTRGMQDAGLEVQQDDVRNLLRRGCGTGFAEAAFVGVDGGTYTARWIVRRARENAGGRLQATEHVLLKGNVPPGTKGTAAAGGTTTQVKKEIVAKLGLSFDQFRRAVLLAQGDFATFLKAPDKERAEILQALTGTERFENLSKAVFQRNKREQEEVQAIRNRIGAALPLSAEDRAAAEEKHSEALGRQKQIESALAGRTRQLEWFEADAEHRKNFDEATREVVRLEAEVEANAPRRRTLEWIQVAGIEAGPRRLAEKQAQSGLAEAVRREVDLRQLDGTLEAAVESAEARHKLAETALNGVLERQRGIDGELARARVLDGELVQIKKAAALAHGEHAGAVQALKSAGDALSTLDVKLAALASQKQAFERRLSRVVAFAPFSAEIGVWLERFKTEEKARLKKGQLENRLRSADRETTEAARHLEKSSGVLPDLREKRTQAEAALEQAAQKAASFRPEEILSSRRNALELQAALQKAQTHLAEQKRIQTEHEQGGESLDVLEKQLEAEAERRLELSERLIPGALSAVNRALESYHLAKAAASEHAAALRETLVRGEACPVCGSREHPSAGIRVSEESAVIAALKKDAGQKEEALRQLQAELAAVEARIDEKKGRREELARQLVRLRDHLRELERYTPGSTEVAEVLSKPARQRDVGLQRLHAHTAELLSTLDKADADRIEAEKLLKSIRSEFENADRRLEAALRAEVEAQNAHATASKERANVLMELEAIREEHGAALAVLSPVISVLEEAGRVGAVKPSEISVGRRDEVTDSGGFRDWFVAEAKEHKAATDLLEQAAQEESAMRPQRGTLEANVAAAQAALAARTAQKAAVDGALSQMEAARAGLLGGRPVQTAEEETVAEVKAAKVLERETEAACVEARKKLGAHRGLLEDQQKRVTALEEEVRVAVAAVDRWIEDFVTRQKRGLDRAQLDEWLARDAQWITREQRELDAAVQQLASARGMKEGMTKQLQEHLRKKTTEEDHETVKTEVERLKAEAALAGEAVDLLKAAVVSDDERIRKTGELSEKLVAQEKQADPWGKLNDLIGSSDGTRFRNIAQQWTLEILLRHANAQLERLSGRYRLERLRDSLNLLVTDLEMDGQQRSVHSLSGGESFLVSLGLALGLASLTSSRLLIESLFIDEGFGSLDSETLRVALNALNHLEAQGRKVGVISHVGEMVDAIPVQVRVVRGSGGSSKIVV